MALMKTPGHPFWLVCFLLITGLHHVMPAPTVEENANALKKTTETLTMTETAIGVVQGSYYWFTETYTATYTLNAAMAQDLPGPTTLFTSTTTFEVLESTAPQDTATSQVDSLAVRDGPSEQTVELGISNVKMRDDADATKSSIAPTCWGWHLKCIEGDNTTWIRDCFDRGVRDLNHKTFESDKGTPPSTGDVDMELRWEKPNQLTGQLCMEICRCDYQGYFQCPLLWGKCHNNELETTCMFLAGCRCGYFAQKVKREAAANEMDDCN